MNQDAEEIIIPTETQGLTTLRRWGLMVFLGISLVLLATVIVASVIR